MNNLLLFGLLPIVMFTSCLPKSQNSITENVEEELNEMTLGINLSKNVKEVQQLNLSDAVERVEIVKLETTDESILSNIHYVKVTSNDIWVKHYKDYRIFRFSRNGKFLNTVGKIGQGPGEYVQSANFQLNDTNKEIYIQSTTNGILAYDYDGNFKRYITKKPMDQLFSCREDFDCLIYFNKEFLLTQHLYVMRPIVADSLWSLAWVDKDFNITKIFKNPTHIGKEADIFKNSRFSAPDPTFNLLNYYIDEQPSYSIYGNQLTLKFADTDTIYVYDKASQSLQAQYAIFTNESKGNYHDTHVFLKDEADFGFFTITGYYPTQDYIYLLGFKGKRIFTYRYNKRDQTVQLTKRDTDFRHREFGYPKPFITLWDNSFKLTNDLSGGTFTVDYRSEGKYWINALQPGSSEFDTFVSDLKKSPDAPQKQQLLDVIARTGEEDNPILLIAVLK